jgi:hypothetical protein
LDQVPAFTPAGVIPPFAGKASDRHGRSPYPVSMGYLITRFGTNPVRRQILRGLLDYRKLLFDGGFRTGFLWLDGSFVENAEIDRNRAPSDIDLVTLFHRPIRYQIDKSLWNKEFQTLYATYFSRANCLARYKCDAFPIDLDQSPSGVVGDVTYWFSLFSHHKVSSNWKGMLQISLISTEVEYTNELLLLNQAENKSDA